MHELRILDISGHFSGNFYSCGSVPNSMGQKVAQKISPKSGPVPDPKLSPRYFKYYTTPILLNCHLDILPRFPYIIGCRRPESPPKLAQVYNSLFLDIAPHVKTSVVTSIARLGEGGIRILNLAVPKPSIPADIAQNYKQVGKACSKNLHSMPIWVWDIILSKFGGPTWVRSTQKSMGKQYSG